MTGDKRHHHQLRSARTAKVCAGGWTSGSGWLAGRDHHHCPVSSRRGAKVAVVKMKLFSHAAAAAVAISADAAAAAAATACAV